MTVRLPPGYALAAFDEIDSTNEEAKRRAEIGERGPLWILARRQTAGRGRRGRSWTSLEGNLSATLLLDPGCAPSEAARLSFAAALSAHDLCAALCPQAKVRLKWPNDVLIDGRKCSGILLESAGERSGRLPWLAVGIGVNLAHAPEAVAYPAAALSAYGASATPEDALALLAESWDGWFKLWRSQGFAALRGPWLERAEGIGRTISVQLGDTRTDGVFEGLDTDGALTMRLADGSIKAVSSGEVFFGGL